MSAQLVSKSKLVFPKEVDVVLQKAGKNRGELEKAIDYFRKGGDTLKLKAICFLVANIDIHFSISYKWFDSKGNRLAFDDQAYTTYSAYKQAFDSLCTRVPDAHKAMVKCYDIDTITASYLIDNIDRAFDVYQKPWVKHLPFEIFCEYILPYRINIEPLQYWRAEYQNIFLLDSVRSRQQAAHLIFKKAKAKFSALNTNDQRIATASWITSTVQCENWANLQAKAMRSQGIPCTVDFASNWATSSGRHSWDVYFNDALKPHAFDAQGQSLDTFILKREPTMIFRYTYSKQPGTLASLVPQNEIPEGYFQLENYIDVTNQYWQVCELNCALPLKKTKHAVAYACVWNAANWTPGFWGKVTDNNVKFPSVAKGAVYLPMYFEQNTLIPAGYPIAVGYKHQQILIPDLKNKRTITVKEQEKYLMFRPDKKYNLYYWDYAWKSIEVKTTGFSTHELVFENVPGNALLMLIPEYSQGKERPFMITEQGERIWW
jgi:hypothetical protein